MKTEPHDVVMRHLPYLDLNSLKKLIKVSRGLARPFPKSHVV